MRREVERKISVCVCVRARARARKPALSKH